MRFIKLQVIDGKLFFKSYKDFMIWLVFMPIAYVTLIVICIIAIPVIIVNSCISKVSEAVGEFLYRVGVYDFDSLLDSFVDINTKMPKVVYEVLIIDGVKIDKTIGDDK